MRWISHVVCAQRSDWWGIVVEQVSDSAGHQTDRADEGIATETKANHFATHGILLRCENERHKGGSG
jgi:hypothetical protein